MSHQIFTSKDKFLGENEIFESEPLSGAVTLTASKKPSVSSFLGFGVAITPSSCYILSKLDKEERGALLREIYTKEGLDLCVGRISIGSCDYSAELYTYEDKEGNFSVERDEKYIIPVIKEILELKPDLYLVASPWSPPARMKTGASLGGGYMRAEFIGEYADYTVKFLKAYESYGIHISAITLQNEPETQQSGRMPACIWHPEIEAEYAVVLRKKLNEAKLDVKLLINDHNFAFTRRVMWQLENCAGLAEAIDGAAFHYYGGEPEMTRVIPEAYPNLELHFTEGGPRLYDHYEDDFCKWVIMASRALSSGYKSFTGWNLMLDERGGPNVGPFFCGGLLTRHSESGEIKYSGQYKALRHLSPYISKSSEIYALTTDEWDAMTSYPSEMRRPVYGILVKNDGKYTLILANGNAEKKQVQIKLCEKWYYIELMPDTVSTVII